MRPIELVLWLEIALWGAWWIINSPSRQTQKVFVLTTLGLIGLHATLEGVRVHMLPTYGLGGIMTALAAARSMRPGGLGTTRGVRRIVALPLFALATFIAVALPSVFPVFSYDEPTGPYRIGTSVYVLRHGPANRDLVAQVWYPGERFAVQATPVPITTHPALLEDAYASFTGIPRPLFDHLRLVRTHATADTPVARDKKNFPVVLFSHGPLAANRSQSIFQMEALATAGFIVIAVDHTGYASTTIFPDGRGILPLPDAAWPAIVNDRSTAMVRTWVSDVSFVLDWFEEVNNRDPKNLLTGRLDFSRVGYLGASFGGSVVVQALLDEPRIKAGVAEDGKPYFSDRALTELQRPLMYMQSAAPYIRSSDAQLARWGLSQASFRAAEQDHYARQMQLFGHTTGPVFNVFIRGTNHVTFSDLDLIVHVPDVHSINIRRAHRIINAYTLAFFERYLDGTDRTLVDGQTPSPYEEVTVASRNVTAADSMALMH